MSVAGQLSKLTRLQLSIGDPLSMESLAQANSALQKLMAHHVTAAATAAGVALSSGWVVGIIQ
jgi:hypothetical protein